MTDGPFKNLKLGRSWKRLANAVQNEATSATECGLLACDGLVRHLATNENCAALDDLEAYFRRKQLEFDPLASIEAIFDAHEKTPFLDTLQKMLPYKMQNDSSPLGAALDATIKDQQGETRSRFEEEFIRARDTGEMSKEACQQALDKIAAAFDAVKPQDVRVALRARNKNAFREVSRKKEGLDEGPRL
jgi:hypothetical protein